MISVYDLSCKRVLARMQYYVRNISCGFQPPDAQKVDNAINSTIVFSNTYGSLYIRFWETARLPLP